MKKFFKERLETETKAISDEEREVLIKKELKRINRRNRIKKAVFVFFMAIVVIGSMKGLLGTKNTSSNEEVENEAFVIEYVDHYYHYPLSEEDETFIKNYTYAKVETNRIYEDIDFASVSDIRIYKVETVDETKGILAYYITATYHTKEKDQDEISNPLFCKLEVAKNDNKYLVVKPVINVSYERDYIQDEDVLDQFEYKIKHTSENMSDVEKSEVTETIHLFLKTYNDDITQAKLLVSNPDILDTLDSNTTLEVDSISNVSKDEDSIYVQAKVKEKYLNISTITKNYFFEIDIEKNKIKTMEVY